MSISPAVLIHQKRMGGAHTQEEIQWLIRSYTSGELPDYQMSAWAMAVCFQGLSDDETAWLTASMRDSGHKLNFSHLKAPRIDKHSTGGVGDKTSLIVGPILAACEIYTPMIAGRGLGHTGGTLDKFESIPGFRIHLDEENFTRNVEKYFFSVMGQTEQICPADKKFYSLRDVTGTVDSLPLICGSIMSKKLAEDLSGLVLDIKFGSGAFMKKIDQAEALANLLKSTGEKNGLKVHALLTNMDQPLGRFAGNAPEVQECIDILQGKSKPSEIADRDDYADTRELSLELAAHGIFLAGKAKDLKSALQQARSALESGSAWNCFEKLMEYQGPAKWDKLPQAPFEKIIQAPRSGFLQHINTEKLGLASIELGVGRKKSNDRVDPAAGIEILVRPGDPVEKSQPLFRLLSSTQKNLSPAAELVNSCLKLSDTSTQKYLPLISKVIT